MKTFLELGLSEEILRATNELGFTVPTPIQEKTIPAILHEHRDMVALAQTGTGKTAGYGMPVIQQINQEIPGVQSLILCPTRELCMQITKDLNTFSKYYKNISVTAVYGGASIEGQIRSIRKSPQIIVGTPGRTLDLIKRKVLKINKIKWLILDEADEMLNMGFRNDLDRILETTPENRQTLLFSATMSKELRDIAGNYMKNPMEFSSGKINTGADKVVHHYYVVNSQDRYMTLKKLADMHSSIYALIFCRTRAETTRLAGRFKADGYNAGMLHGDLSQPQRDLVMNRFRTRQIKFLVATDVAARGLDINDLTHVINYNLPEDPELYIHRSGRTGRAGKTGISISLSSPGDTGKIRELERKVGRQFQFMAMPGSQQISEKRYSRFFINVGSKQSLRAPKLISLINENTRKRDIDIGKIDILNNFSFFEVEKDQENTILNAFKNSSFGNQKLLVQLSKSSESHGRPPRKKPGLKRTHPFVSDFSGRMN